MEIIEKGLVFWDNREMFERRRSLIIDLLTPLDVSKTFSYRINKNLFILPNDFDENETRHITEIFFSETEKFQGPGKLFGIYSNDPEYLVGSGNDVLTFTLEDIKVMPYTLTNDYVSQLILLFCQFQN